MTSAPSLIELVLKPFPSERLQFNQFMQGQIYDHLKNISTSIVHCPMADLDFLFENPKLKQRRIASGSIPPPSSVVNM